LREPLAREPLAGNTIHEAIDPRQVMVLDVAFTQLQRELIDVAAKMLWAGVMVDADQTALHDREKALDSVRGHVIFSIKPDIDTATHYRTFQVKILHSMTAIQKKAIREVRDWLDTCQGGAYSLPGGEHLGDQYEKFCDQLPTALEKIPLNADHLTYADICRSIAVWLRDNA
jgi:hypothetical protein